MIHIPVLLKESVDELLLKEGKIFIDGTLGGGGHSGEVLKRFGKGVRVIGLDRNPETLRQVEERLGIETKVQSFADIDTLDINPDAILLDLGISSDQLDNSGKGFSFQKNEPLDMRMSDKGITAADILNSWDDHAIELILRGFGEEKYSRRIASEIVRRREEKPFETTFDLVEAVTASRPKNPKEKTNPATKTFQALRIAVNEELTALENGLEKGWKVLNPGGRFAVISFHSLEDRIVKNFFRDRAKGGEGRLITKKPITPTEEEVKANPRSRSAKLRVVEKNER